MDGRLTILTFGRSIIAEASSLSWTITKDSSTDKTSISGIVAVSKINRIDLVKSENVPPVDITFVDMKNNIMIQLFGVELLDSGYALKTENFRENREYQFLAYGIS